MRDGGAESRQRVDAVDPGITTSITLNPAAAFIGGRT
jgi:hypothetical protein